MKTIEVMVKYDIHIHFRRMAEEHGAICKKVIEIKCCVLLLYIFEIQEVMEDYILDLGFMTFIQNPEFQKYYSDTPEFKLISAEYLKSKNQ